MIYIRFGFHFYIYIEFLYISIYIHIFSYIMGILYSFQTCLQATFEIYPISLMHYIFRINIFIYIKS